MTDPISDMITRIRNAGATGKESVDVSYSKIKEALLSVLHTEGYIQGFEKKGKGVKKQITISLLYSNNRHRISGIERVSKYSRRQYAGFKELTSVKGGRGMYVLSTPQGVVSDKKAKEQKVGGEVMIKIW